MTIITISNRTRKLGLGYELTFLHSPIKPDYVGTIKQIKEEKRTDAILIASNDTFKRWAWFYGDNKITAVHKGEKWLDFINGITSVLERMEDGETVKVKID